MPRAYPRTGDAGGTSGTGRRGGASPADGVGALPSGRVPQTQQRRRLESRRNARTATTALLGALLLGSAAVAAQGSARPADAIDDPSHYAAYGQAGQFRNILPPGSNGNVNAIDAATLGLTTQGTTATPTSPAHFADQLETYDSLNTVLPSSITDAALPTYYKDAKLGISAADTVSAETPRAGTTIKRDKDGVPHVFGDSYDDTAYGAGIIDIEDRMFLTDVLRNTGEANMAQFAGGTAANIAMDQTQLQLAPYTPAQAEAQVEQVVARYPGEGQKLLGALDAYLQGLNDEIDKLCPLSTPTTPVAGLPGLGFGPSCPVEYAALQRAPQHYTRGDIVGIASLVAGIFGKGGGNELANTTFYQHLLAEQGSEAKARAVYDDLRERKDPEAPTTSPTRVDFGLGALQPDLPGVALPDVGGPTAPGTGSVEASSTPSLPTLPPVPLGSAGTPVAAVDTPDGQLPLGDLGLTQHGMSNALLVDAAHSTSGHPTVVFGPQTGYFTPQLLVEEDLEGPGMHARGVSFAGTNLIVQLGHGVDYAWSATSSDDDNVDIVADPLCNADGSAATVDSTSYLGADGRCTPMETFTHTEVITPGATGVAAQKLDLLVLKTRHGPVIQRAQVKGQPVALSYDRSTYGHELDSAVGFARIDDPTQTASAADFARGFSAVDYTFNWFYTDDRDISYFNSALLPVRSTQVDPDLPRFGASQFDDTGFATIAQHPQVTNPPQGYLVSWNNKQAPGFAAADSVWGYGPVYRSLALEDRVKASISGGKKIDRGQLVGDMIDAGTVDVRADYTLPLILRVLDSAGPTPNAQDAAAIALLRQWVADGTHRVDRARTGSYDHASAVALMDAWWDSAAALDGGTVSLPKDVLRARLGAGADEIPQPYDDHPRQGLGSSWNAVPFYGYLNKDLRQVLGEQVAGAYSQGYCGKGVLADCRATLLASLDSAVTTVEAKQKVTSVGALTFDKTGDDIVSRTAGVVGVRKLDWQNRPTFQQVVQLTDHRPRATPVTTTTTAGTTPPKTTTKTKKKAAHRTTRTVAAPTRSLAATGLPGGVPAAAGVLLLGCAALRVRRRRHSG